MGVNYGQGWLFGRPVRCRAPRNRPSGRGPPSRRAGKLALIRGGFARTVADAWQKPDNDTTATVTNANRTGAVAKSPVWRGVSACWPERSARRRVGPRRSRDMPEVKA